MIIYQKLVYVRRSSILLRQLFPNIISYYLLFWFLLQAQETKWYHVTDAFRVLERMQFSCFKVLFFAKMHLTKITRFICGVSEKERIVLKGVQKKNGSQKYYTLLTFLVK